MGKITSGCMCRKCVPGSRASFAAIWPNLGRGTAWAKKIGFSRMKEYKSHRPGYILRGRLFNYCIRDIFLELCTATHRF